MNKSDQFRKRLAQLRSESDSLYDKFDQGVKSCSTIHSCLDQISSGDKSLDDIEYLMREIKNA